MSTAETKQYLPISNTYLFQMIYTKICCSSVIDLNQKNKFNFCCPASPSRSERVFEILEMTERNVKT